MRLAIFTLCAVVISGPVLAAESDIVWPTYDQAERPGDASLNCTQLQGQIAHVSSGLVLLNKAQVTAENALRSAFDMERYAGSRSAGSQRVGAGTVGGKEIYASARQQITASLRVVAARRDYLKGLEPGCRPAPQQTPVP